MQFESTRIANANGQLIATATIPKGFWAQGRKEDLYQSRLRPFRLAFTCGERPDGTGNQLYGDTGEAFVDARDFAHGGAAQGSALYANGQHNLLGGALRPFESVEKYLDAWAAEIFDLPPRKLLRYRLLNKSTEDCVEDERAATQALVRECQGLTPGSTVWVGHRALDRTVVRYYEAADKNGNDRYVAVGASMGGKDIVVYPAGGARSLANSRAGFGQAPAAGAVANMVQWWSRYRFATSFLQSAVSFDEFVRITYELGRTMSFSPELLSQMSAESNRLRQADAERVQRETEASRQRLALMKQRQAESEAAHARMQQQFASDLEASRARREAWDRQQDADRRRRHMWSDAIRDVDRYEHPYDGGTIEVEAGHGHRAFYNPAEDRVITADSDLNIPFGYEELRRKDD